MKNAVDTFRSVIPLFQALGDPFRQDIILMLAEHETLTVNEITEKSTLSRPAISHHLKLLTACGLVTHTKVGTQRHYALTLEDGVAQLKALIAVVEAECIL